MAQRKKNASENIEAAEAAVAEKGDNKTWKYGSYFQMIYLWMCLCRIDENNYGDWNDISNEIRLSRTLKCDDKIIELWFCFNC